MPTFDEIVDALDDLRSGGGQDFDRMLNAMIRARRVRDDHMRDDVRSSVYEFLTEQIQKGVPSVMIAPLLWRVVQRRVADEFESQARTLRKVDSDPDPSDRNLLAPSAERSYETSEHERMMYERYTAVERALAEMRDSDKSADRRHFAAIDAARNGESPRERLFKEFGEELTDDAAAHVVARGREKLRKRCGIKKSKTEI